MKIAITYKVENYSPRTSENVYIPDDWSDEFITLWYIVRHRHLKDLKVINITRYYNEI